MPVERPRLRDDILIRERERDGQTFYVVLDPIRGEYNEMDDLQREILVRLDGRTLAELSKALETEFGLEIPEEMIAAFVDEIQGLNLLDPGSDLRLDAARLTGLAGELRADLEQRGVVVQRSVKRRLDWLGVHGAPGTKEARREYFAHRKKEHAAALFDRALDYLDRGELRLMAEHLRFIMDLDVDDWRPRYLHQALLRVHLGKKKKKQSIWWWTIPVASPDRFLRRLDAAIGRFVFTRATFIVWLVLMGTAMTLLASDADRLIRDLSDPLALASTLLDPLFLALFYVVGPLIITSHEISHGLACTHYGGKVREMGVLLSYFSATAYCDISSSYLFKDRGQRIIVSLIGTLFHGTVWAIFAITYHFAVPDSYVGRLAALSVPLLGATALFGGWNPLVKNDAYFALTDLVEYPNLRHDAFDYLKLRVLNLTLGEQIEIPETYLARRRLLLWYSIPAVIFTGLTMVLGVGYVVGALIDKLRGLGALLGCALVAMILGPHVLRIFRWVWTSRRQLLGYPRLRWVLGSATVIVAAIAAIPRPLAVETSFRVHPELTEIRAPFESRVAALLVEVGSRVEAGQPIAQLDSTELNAELAAAESALDRAARDLEVVSSPKRREEIDQRRSALSSAIRVRELARQRIERLAAHRLDPKAYEAALAQGAAADTVVVDAMSALREVTASSSDEELRAAQAELAFFQAEAQAIRERIAQGTIVSPAAGIIATRIGERGDPMRFAVVKQGEILASVRPEGGALTLEAQVPLTEPLAALRPGAVAIARLVGVAHTELQAEVTSVATNLDAAAAGRSHLVVSLEVRGEENLDLPAGLSGRARVNGESYPLAFHAYFRAKRLLEIELEEAIY